MVKIVAKDKGKVLFDKEILDKDNKLTAFGASVIAAELAFDATLILLISSLIVRADKRQK